MHLIGVILCFEHIFYIFWDYMDYVFWVFICAILLFVLNFLTFGGYVFTSWCLHAFLSFINGLEQVLLQPIPGFFFISFPQGFQGIGFFPCFLRRMRSVFLYIVLRRSYLSLSREWEEFWSLFFCSVRDWSEWECESAWSFRCPLQSRALTWCHFVYI